MKIVVFGDMHLPWADRRAVKRALEHVAGASHVVQIGDLYDLYCFSRYPKNPNLGTPQQELTRGREHAEAFWAEVKRRAPKAKRYQLKGNHDDRLQKRVMEVLPEAASLDLGAEFWRFEGVETMPTSRDLLEIAGIAFEHGCRPFGRHAPYNQQSTVTGHLHRAGLQYFRQRRANIFELNVGYLGNEAAPVFAYSPTKRTQWTLPTIGVIDDLGPRVVALA